MTPHYLCSSTLEDTNSSALTWPLSFPLTAVIRWAVRPSNGKLPACASQQMQAYSGMEVFILVLPGYAKLMVPFKCHHYAANTYSSDSYVKNNHEEEELETFMSRITIYFDVLHGTAFYSACHLIYEHCFVIKCI
jgi:hypothetical protein